MMEHDDEKRGQEKHGDDFTEADLRKIAESVQSMMDTFTFENPKLCSGCAIEFMLLYIAQSMAASTWEFDDVMPILASAFDVRLVAASSDSMPEDLMDELEKMVNGPKPDDTVH